jgi:DNA-binding NtrC family response regulator
MVLNNTFREDLFYRINLITINLPPLRERKGDIPILANYFLNTLKEIYNIGDVSINQNTLKWLQELPFFGNIRELKNLVERTWLMAGKNELEINDFEKALEQTTGKPQSVQFPEPGSMTLEEMEKEMIIKTINKYNGNISKVAKSLGLSRGTLYRRLEKFDIPFN